MSRLSVMIQDDRFDDTGVRLAWIPNISVRLGVIVPMPPIERVAERWDSPEPHKK